MGIVTSDMVAISGAEFVLGAQGYFTARTTCPSCGEKRDGITVPISEPGQQWNGQANCNAGHS
jgi:hypothetical protein